MLWLTFQFNGTACCLLTKFIVWSSKDNFSPSSSSQAALKTAKCSLITALPFHFYLQKADSIQRMGNYCLENENVDLRVGDKYGLTYGLNFLWSKHTDNQRDSPSLSVFINKIRKLNLADILSNNSNCCNLCSQ